MADPYFGKGARLASQEKFSTPKPTKPPLSATVGLGPHHAPPVDPHAHHLPGFVPKQGGQVPRITKAQAPKKLSFSEARKQHEAAVEQGRKELAAAKGESFTKLPKWAQRGLAQQYIKIQKQGNGYEQAVDRQVTPLFQRAAKVGNPAITVPANIAGNALAQVSGVPSAIAAVNAAKQHHFAAAGVEAASLLPLGKLGKALKGAKAGVEAAKVAEDVAKAEPAGAAELRGALAGKIPPMGQFEKVGAKLDSPSLGKSAGQLINEQEKLRSPERAKRIAEHDRIFKEAIAGGMDPEEAHKLAGKALAGVMPKLEFTAGKELNRENIGALFSRIQDHPDLRPYERLRTRIALLKVFDGSTPQRNELKLLTKVFGESDTKKLVANRTLWKQLKGTAGELINVPRALMSTLDISALLRQNLVATITHPNITRKNVMPMLRALKSEKGYQAIEDYVVTHPDFERAQKGGLALTDFEGHATREEPYFGANLAEKLTGGTHSPVRMSGRAYVGLLNKTRMDIFSSLVKSAEKAGRDINDEKLLRDLAKSVNSATGRGHGPEAIQSWLPALNTIFFSPRLLMSRLDYLNYANYTKLDPIARKEYLKGALSLVGTLGTVLTMAKLAGAQVGTDPRSADFAKIKMGNTRIDILGGFQQPIRVLAQLSPSFMGGDKVISSTTGKTLTLGPEGPGKLSRYDIAERFLQGKLAPVPGMIVDAAKGTDFQGKPLSLKGEAYQHLSPLAIQDAISLAHESGPAAAAGGYGLSALGIGVQTYGPKKPKATKSSSTGDAYFGSAGSSGGGDPYFGR